MSDNETSLSLASYATLNLETHTHTTIEYSCAKSFFSIKLIALSHGQ
jgi:hypothetical protein